MHDEAILASLDGEPDRFAVLFRRHVEELHDWLLSRTHDAREAAELCAETFAAALEDAHRYDSGNGPPDRWLYAIARRLLADAQRRGVVSQRARRRLGLAALEPGDRFESELEEELVEAARFRAARRSRRPPVPRAALPVAAALALAGIVAALALGGDGDRRRTPAAQLVQSGADGCRRAVAPQLLERVAALRRPPDRGLRLPAVAHDALAGLRLDAIVDAGARFATVSEEVEFWVVPVVPLGSRACAPADGACVVAITRDERAAAECAIRDERPRDATRLAPLLEGHAAIFGIVPDGVSGARVTIAGLTEEVEARDNVIGAVLPFPYRDTAATRVAIVRD